MRKALTLSHEQYRGFAELCKAEAGQALEVSSTDAMNGDWAQAGFMAWEVIADVRASQAAFALEVSRIELADSIIVGDFRRAGRSRPETNWDALTDDEIYPFIVWHEIGHRRDNFNMLDVMMARSNFPDEVVKRIRWVNEVLADRFAWAQIRPGEMLAKTEGGKRDAQLIEDTIALMAQHCQRAKFKPRPIPGGQYAHVSPRMLESPRLAAFVGPDVHPELLAHYVWKSANRPIRSRRPAAIANHQTGEVVA
ncbi:hypothetical protein [Achromobacter sp. 2789STDY5608628]|uniref:hypothetical protein n=1 Tax=Achromobacter sp. 2789STDY5608628 TaxID=1806493 RepID=UPI0006C61978|nr:hypothetical protein [Achromobacter sp. 2789STDY5608628]CUJ80941.1 Uncharacterised protein [Achromobacter sp. 2789STDY5608628]